MSFNIEVLLYIIWMSIIERFDCNHKRVMIECSSDRGEWLNILFVEVSETQTGSFKNS